MTKLSVKELTAGASGTKEYLAKVQKVRDALVIPRELQLPSTLLEDVPLDVRDIPASCGLLTPLELKITELDATGVAQAVAAKTYTAVQVVTAFGKRAAIAHQVTGCLTRYFLEEGIETAKELDAYYEKHGKVKGPLHGVPISIKEHMSVKGHYTSSGFLSTLHVSEKDCDLVAMLRQAGAVFYCKTNQPQGIMHQESHSFYERTLNPFNIKLSSGGSSGGEAALVAMKGSAMGLGTDIGGSIRQPSANCGIYGIRPTATTTPMRGMSGPRGAWDGIKASTGPMCHSARDVNLYFNTILSTEPHLRDPSLTPVTWPTIPELPKGTKLRVGLMLHDGAVLPHPPTLRALEFAKSKLQAHPDIEVVDYLPFKHDHGYDLARELYFPDGGKDFDEALAASGEEKLYLSEQAMSKPWVKDHTATEISDLLGQRDVYRNEYLEHWNSFNVDVVLCAPTPGTAGPHDTATYWAYCAVWNLVDYPGYVFPTGLHVDPAVDKKPIEFKPMSTFDEINNRIYDPNVQINAPVSLQLVARRWNDAFLVAAQQKVERVIRG